jgi:uncharacterized protein YukE
VGVLDGFLSTWSGARATFGDGDPQDGSRFDQSATLTQLRDRVDAAKPQAWQGTTADSYASANATQSQILGELSGLDHRLGAEVTRSAAVVTAGRRDLDAVRKWVLDAAATVPATAAGERTLIPIVAKGNGEIAEILTRSHGDLSAVAQRIREIGGEYGLVGDRQGRDGVTPSGG